MRKVREFRPLYRLTGVAAAVALGLILPGAVAHAQSAFGAGIKLAPNIARAEDLSAPKGGYVITNETPLYKAPTSMVSDELGVSLKVGEKPQIIAEAQAGVWLLVGKDGTGIGYISRGLACPTSICK